jgi:iron complex outermembrane receptor protein
MKKIFLLILFLFILQAAQTQVIQGKITDTETGRPLYGANVMINTLNIGAISSFDGTYHIAVSGPGYYMISCSFIGYVTIEKKVDVTKNIVNVNFELNPDYKQLEGVIIQGEITSPVRRTGDALYTGSALTSKGITLMGPSANSSVYNTLDILPGIAVEGQDAYGLADKTMRIRCISSIFSGMTVEGFPNYGIMPIGARDGIYDMENMKSIAVYKGATPSDLGTATGSKGGAIELQYKRPSDTFTFHVKQSAGTSDFFRSFARLDIGKLKTGTNAFVSGSHTAADKWKGYGKLGPRYNVAIGITQVINKKINIELFGNYNTISRYDFKALTYKEASDIKNSFTDDYSEILTGDPVEDLYYYDYNKGEYTNRDLMGILTFKVSDSVKLIVKTYYSNEDANYYLTEKKGLNDFMFNRVRDINRAGAIAELHRSFNSVNYTAGYWFESGDNNVYVYNFRIVADGLEPVGYSYYPVQNKRGQIHSPYLKIAYNYHKINIQAGLKYFSYCEPESERYTSVSPTELSANPDPDLYSKTMKYNALLPTLGLGYDFTGQLQAYINYGKNYMRPYMYMPVISLYVSNIRAFKDNGISLQSIFDSWKMETSDNIDLGVRYSSRLLTTTASLFYSKHYNVLASAYDPDVKLDYYQNVGELTSRGIDIEFYIRPLNHLIIFANPAYNLMTYDNNLVRANDINRIKGNQSPATPKISIKSGIFYSIRNFDFSLLVKYTGERYGEATNTEKIDACTLTDIGIKYSYDKILFINDLQIGIDIKNLFNTKYVGPINVSDDSYQGIAVYYAGIPRNIVASLSITF